jgi:DNA (cytosine-5)-methyltransferase 1
MTLTLDRGRIDALDWFAGCGGTAAGAQRTGKFDIIVAANHWDLACQTYGTNNPHIDVRCADLQAVDPVDMPPARVLFSTPECTNHSQANAERMYQLGLTLFDQEQDAVDPEHLRKERSRATMSCSLRYAAKHQPEFVFHENVVEAAWWGMQVPGKKRGDGTTYQWWRNEWQNNDYEVHELFLNAGAFGAPQLRDRFIMLCRRKDVPKPNLVFEPPCWCPNCERIVEGRQRWKQRTKNWPLHEWGRLGRQYDYVCPTCRSVCVLDAPGAYTITDWSDLGETIGERAERGRPLAESTIERVRLGYDRLGGEPWVMPTRTKAYGMDSAVADPMLTLTGRQDKALVVPPSFFVKNYGGFDEAKYRAHPITSPLGAVTCDDSHMLVTFPPSMVVELRNGGSRTSGQRPVTEPMGTVTSGGYHHALVTMPAAMWAKNNGGPGDTRYHPTTEPLGTITGVDSTSLVTIPPKAVDINEFRLRMYRPDELQLVQTFTPEYEILGSNRDKTKQIGDAVPPVLSHAVSERMAAALEGAA